MFSIVDLLLTKLANSRPNDRPRTESSAANDVRLRTSAKVDNKSKRQSMEKRNSYRDNSYRDKTGNLSSKEKKYDDISDSQDLQSESRNSSVHQHKHKNLNRQESSQSTKSKSSKSKTSKSHHRKRYESDSSGSDEAVTDRKVERATLSMKNARKYKSVELLRSSSDENLQKMSSKAKSTLSLKQDERKIKEKQLYLELKRKQERARRSKLPDSQSIISGQVEEPGIDSTNSLNSQFSNNTAKKRGPIIPPKPKAKNFDRSDQMSTDSRESLGEHRRDLNSINSAEDLSGELRQFDRWTANGKLSASMPRSKMSAHDEILTDYFKRAPIEKDLEPGLDRPSRGDALEYARLQHGTQPRVTSSAKANYNRGGNYRSYHK